MATAETKERKANHIYFDSAGKELEELDFGATQYKYQDLSDKSEFAWDATTASHQVLTAMALFAAKTLATNEASQVRQRSKADNGGKDVSTGVEQVEGIKARFDLIASGTWVDRTREGIKWNNDHLANAMVTALSDDGKLTTDEQKAKALANALAKLTDADEAKAAAFSKTLRDNPKIVAAYRALAGGKQATTSDDVMAALGV